MASMKTCTFFEQGTHAQFEFVFSKYDEAMHAKAHNKSSKPETLLKLDKWYQYELPKKIKARGNDKFLTHDEIVQTIKWKLARGQFRPRLKDLVQMNTPRVVMQDTKKAFRKLAKMKDVESAVVALSQLKGVGPAMASAVLAAGAPEMAPFMADEVLLAMPDIEGIDYTMKEYIKLVEKTKECVERLNSQGGDWTPHKVELAVWTHYVSRDIKPELLDDMPGSSQSSARTLNGVNGSSENKSEVEVPAENGCAGEEDSRDSGMAEEPDQKQQEEPVVKENGSSVVENGVAEEKNGIEAEKNGTETETNGTVAETNGTVAEKNGTEAEKNGTEAIENGVEAVEIPATAVESPAKAVESPVKAVETVVEAVEGKGTDEANVQMNGDATKEDSVKTSSEKRSLEDAEDSQESEPKRSKDDPTPPQIPAGGD